MKKLKLAFLLVFIAVAPMFLVACGSIEKNNSTNMTTAAQRVNPVVNVTLKYQKTYFERETVSRNDFMLGENDTYGILTLERDVVLAEGANEISWIFTPADQVTYRKYFGKTTIVAQKVVPVSVSVETNPQKRSGYVAYDKFDDTGLTLKVAYNNGSMGYVTRNTNWTISYIDGADHLNAGDDKVIVNYGDLSAEIALTEAVQKFKVQVPTIQERTYNGQNQKAEIVAQNHEDLIEINEFYAKDAGEHDVVVSLKDFDNCMWSDDTDEQQKIVKFNITKADRSVVVMPTYSIYTGENVEVPNSRVKIEDFEENFELDENKLHFVYFLEDGETLTTASNSGSLTDGGAPKFIGNYTIKATYDGDENYNSSSGRAELKNIEDTTGLFDDEVNFGWRYVTASHDTKDLPYLKFEQKLVEGLKVLYLKLNESQTLQMPFESGVMQYIDANNYVILDKNSNEIHITKTGDELTFTLAGKQLVFEKWEVPAYVGRYECDRSEFSGGTDVLEISASDGVVTFVVNYSYRLNDQARVISGTATRQGIVLQDENNILHFITIENGISNEVDSFELENGVPPTNIILRLDVNFREPLTFVKVS